MRVSPGIAAMLAALFGIDEDVQAAVLPGFKQNFLDAVASGSNHRIKAGTFEPDVFAKVQKIFPHIENDVRVSIHPAESRMAKDGWSMERTADGISDLLNSDLRKLSEIGASTKGIANMECYCRMILIHYLRQLLPTENQS